MKLKLLLNPFFTFIFLTLFACSSAQDSSKKDTLRQSNKASFVENTTFEKEFVAYFKVASLPYSAQSKMDMQDTIPAKLVIKDIFEPAESANLHSFDDFWGNDEMKSITTKGLEDRYINVDKNAFAVLNFGYINRLQLNESFYSLIFQAVPTYMEGGYSFTYLANYTPSGELIDVLQIAGNAGFVDLISAWKGEISESGEIKIENKTIKKGGMEDGSDDFSEFAYLVYQIAKNGKFELVNEKYTGISGNFIHADTKEMFKIDQSNAEMRISYKTKIDAEMEEELKIIKFDKEKNSIIAQTEDQQKKFTLTFNDTKTGFVCQKNDSKKESFVRMKN